MHQKSLAIIEIYDKTKPRTWPIMLKPQGLEKHTFEGANGIFKQSRLSVQKECSRFSGILLETP